MQCKTIVTHVAVALASFSMLFAPFYITNADSQATAGVTASVVQQTANSITVNSINAVRTSGFSDGTFENGWKWVFDITIPNTTETNLTMQFSNWTSLGAGTLTIPVANNLRFYSDQSSNAFDQNSAMYINAANTDSSTMILTGNINNSSTMRRVRITTEFRIPTGISISSYSNSFIIKTR